MKRLFILFLTAAFTLSLAPLQAEDMQVALLQDEESQEVVDEINRLKAVAGGEDLASALDAANRLYSHYRAKGDEENGGLWYDQVLAILAKRADAGQVESMNFLAQLHLKGGDYMSPNPAEALKWFEKAAEAGDTKAQYTVATFYMKGIGGDADKGKAAFWFAKAKSMLEKDAARGEGEAAFWLGQIHFQGLGVDKNEKEAFKYFLTSAEVGFLRSQIIVAFMYREGKGTEADEKKSFEWFRKVAEKGDVGAIMEVAIAYKDGKGVEKDPAEARKWLEKGAALNDYYSLRTLATMLDKGDGCERDEAKALEYYERAAECGDVYSLIQAYKKLLSVDRDKAMVLIRKGVYEYKSPHAAYELALYEKEHGDSALSAKLMEDAAKQGYTPAMIEMGKLHLTPFSGATWNPRISHYWWQQAEKHGNEEGSTLNSWLIWGGAGIILLIVIAIVLLINPIIKRRLAEQDKLEQEKNKK